ncbi:sodium:solute symporter [Companilactobacillus versmoldensis]|uniref:Transport protein n=1 Tax=Companilactobacillus versmoldensis DSM 14857 = KCTC 3814 TaxID=1423815 RepID=A0A0R1S9A9_9LACO|nr:sodium:solute symporter [Companilactobacillus versmoldensis]KRL65600.1 transport protein [Companilactobacillus versmoldensis DSM 14857 = KCTC 3814]
MTKVGFGTLNWVVLLVYLVAMLGVGVYFTKKASKNTDAFFKAKSSIPAWAAGFSIYATTLSAITFMSTPEQSFLNDWAYSVGNLSIFLIIPILIKYYVPFFRKLKVTTAYEYLEERFSPVMRVIGSLLFILYHIGRVAIVIYLPIIAITSVSNINPILIACVVGGLCIIYTFLGGIEGVIWSDVIQGMLLLGGALLIIIVGIVSIKGGFGTVVSDAVSGDKFFSVKDWNPGDLTKFIPLIFAGQFFNTLYQYTGSQDVVQRYQTTATQKETNKSLWTNGFLALITIPLFFGMGTVLFSFYKNVGTLPHGFNTSAIVPYFVVTRIPAGIAGLVIAAIFAAAQSTIASSLNAISSCVVTDFKQRFFNHRLKSISDVTLARIIIIVTGLFGLGMSIYLLIGNASKTWDLFLTVTGLFGVPIAGIFAAGIFTKRSNTFGAVLGLILSVIATVFVQQNSDSSLIVATVAFITSFIFTYLISFFAPKKYVHNVVGLTASTVKETYVKS